MDRYVLISASTNFILSPN